MMGENTMKSYVALLIRKSTELCDKVKSYDRRIRTDDEVMDAVSDVLLVIKAIHNVEVERERETE